MNFANYQDLLITFLVLRTYVMIECCMCGLCTSMFTWTWQDQVGVERQRSSTTNRYYLCTTDAKRWQLVFQYISMLVLLFWGTASRTGE